jgi:hypothetical protein
MKALPTGNKEMLIFGSPSRAKEKKQVGLEALP